MNEVGYVTVYIDSITPCLQEVETGRFVETEVAKVTKKSFLKSYNNKHGWYVDWYQLAKNFEIYALYVKGDDTVQGLVALMDDKEAQAVRVQWMCTAPQNNIYEYGKQKYLGVGGHLFAIAIRKSIEYGYEGGIYGFAADKKLLKHYVEKLGADCIGVLHENHFAIYDEASKSIEEVYDYEWTDKRI